MFSTSTRKQSVHKTGLLHLPAINGDDMHKLNGLMNDTRYDNSCSMFYHLLYCLFIAISLNSKQFSRDYQNALVYRYKSACKQNIKVENISYTALHAVWIWWHAAFVTIIIVARIYIYIYYVILGWQMTHCYVNGEKFRHQWKEREVIFCHNISNLHKLIIDII